MFMHLCLLSRNSIWIKKEKVFFFKHFMHFLVFWWFNYHMMWWIIKIFFLSLGVKLKYCHKFVCLFKNLNVEGFCSHSWRLKVLVLSLGGCKFLVLFLEVENFCSWKLKALKKIKWWFCLKIIVLNRRTCTCDV
jgi:hypothetical protein